jgi:hypothetical protein
MPNTEELLQHGIHGLAKPRGFVGEQCCLHLMGAGCGGDNQAGHVLVSAGTVDRREENADRIGTLELEDFADLRFVATIFVYDAQNLAHRGGLS